MSTLLIVVASLLGAGLGPPAAADTPSATERVTIRFNGLHEVLKGGENPLEIGIDSASGSLRRGTLTYLDASFEGPGLDKTTPAKRKARDILGADRIPIEVEFPHQDAKEKPLRVKGYLGPDLCCGKSLEGFVRVPDQARTGDVNITIVWSEGKALKSGSVTLLVSIKGAK